MPYDDAELIDRWRRGDPACFEVLVRRWQDPIGKFLARLVGDADLAQDLSQEVFLRVYRVGERYQENGAFRAWIYRIALNVARDEARRRRPQPLDDAELTSDTAPTEAACERRETAALVAECVARLSPPLREVLVLRHYEEMSFEDIARLLKVPASTLKSRFALALRHLRGLLKQHGLLGEDL